MPSRIILIDLNGSLIDSLPDRRISTEDRIERETYRTWLTEILMDHYVIMITGRPAKYRDQTLMQMGQACGWNPQESYFNALGMPPRSWKNHVLQRFVFQRHGRDPEQYLAIENDPTGRVLYRGYRIKAIEYSDPIFAGGLINA